ncbi:MAG: DUF362 domain-containing protein [Planctomycetota bacterium]|jgi:hypothetical protein
MSESPSNHSNGGVSRRGFLAATAGLVTGAALSTNTAAQMRIKSAEADPNQLLVLPNSPRPRVVIAKSQFAIDGSKVHGPMFRELLEQTMTTVTGTATLSDAWNSLFTRSDMIGLKFNRSAQLEIATTPTVAATLVESLLKAGFDAEQIVCIELNQDSDAFARTTAPRGGFAREATDFGSGKDQLALLLDQVTAILNVPFLKSHNLAMMTGAMKNLSHGLIKHPARFHRNQCSPYIGDINALDQIKGKVRLHLVDALRMVYRDGPEAVSDNISDQGILIASTDPVAVDAVGFSELNRVRVQEELKELAPTVSAVSYIADAHRKGLGVAVPHGMDVVRFRLS